MRSPRHDLALLRHVATALAAVAFAATAAAQSAAPPSTATTTRAAPAPPTRSYWVYAGAESADLIHRIRFGPGGAVVEQSIPIGELPTEMEGPHGLQITRDGKYLIMTTGHGFPDGKWWRFALPADTLVGSAITLGSFPASVDVSPDGLYSFSVNFNLHGEMTPSSVSVVYAPTSTEVARPVTCTMPHGSRMNASATRQYSTCMMDDQLVEIDARTFKVSGRFSVAKGQERAIAPGEYEQMMAGMMPADSTGGKPAHKMAPQTCSPTWAQPAAKGSVVFVACNKSDEIVEVDAATWTMTRKIPTGRGPYNLAVTPDGKLLVATLKPGSSLQVFDIATGKSVMLEKTSNTLAHGVVVSPDSRYAFVTSEGVGAQPGKVDVFDLVALQKVASVDIGQQASGIAFWKMQ
jgi:DNA-binding beta-propeller fold protein YncE